VKNVLISKDESKKIKFIEDIINHKSIEDDVIYIYPKNRKKSFKGAFCVTFEDITKDNEWLSVNSILSKNTIIIMENPSRYPKITSKKYEYLYRLAMKAKDTYIVDIVPFTLDIVYLYTTYVYISRAILGHAHWYAFRENYQEQLEDGSIVSGHDHALLAQKIMKVTQIDYPQFCVNDREIIPNIIDEIPILSVAGLFAEAAHLLRTKRSLGLKAVGLHIIQDAFA